MMSRHGVKPDSLRKHEAQIRSGINDGHRVEQWEPALQLIEQANYMKFFRPRLGFLLRTGTGTADPAVLPVQLVVGL